MDVNRLAPWYRYVEYAAFGRALERTRFAFLHHLCDARRILILGEGDGRALERLLRYARRDAEIDVHELSPVMIRLARARTNSDPRVRFHQTDLRALAPSPAPYDAITTLFLLDCFPQAEAEKLIATLASSLAPTGLWLHADFEVPAAPRLARIHGQFWVASMYRFFRLTTGLAVDSLPNLAPAFAALDYDRVATHHQRAGLINATLYRKPQA